MNLDSFTGPGSTPSRRRFWDKVTQAVIASQKSSGKNVSVAEHQGMGTIVNVDRNRGAAVACPSLTVIFNDVLIDCGCYVPPGGGLSQLYTDGGEFNGITFPTASDTSHECATCAVFQGDPLPQFHEVVYLTEDCTGDPISDGDHPITNLAIAQIGGTWYVAARFFTVYFFFGSASDLSSPIPNLITECNLTPMTFTNAFTDCYGSAWKNNIVMLGHGGTAAVTVI